VVDRDLVRTDLNLEWHRWLRSCHWRWIEETRRAASSDGGCIQIVLRSDEINHFPPHPHLCQLADTRNYPASRDAS
jgi:hypothetical protein